MIAKLATIYCHDPAMKDARESYLTYIQQFWAALNHL
jgi:hypothetical protein